jgi:hypothetical protein
LTEPTQHQSPQTTVPLKDPAMAALLAWLVPGLGHLYQGRTAKAILYFVCLMGMFVYGCYLGGSRELGWARVVYMAWGDDDTRLAYICQAGIGLPAFPALVQASRARNEKDPQRGPMWGGFMAPPLGDVPGTERPPADDQTRSRLQADRYQKHAFTVDELNLHLAGYFELGTVYTMIAGLLNILAIYDAWGGPVFPEVKKEEEEKKKEPGATGDEEVMR